MIYNAPHKKLLEGTLVASWKRLGNTGLNEPSCPGLSNSSVLRWSAFLRTSHAVSTKTDVVSSDFGRVRNNGRFCDVIKRFTKTAETHRRIGRDEFKRFFDLARSGPSTDVEKVGRVAPIQFNNVHCGHGQAGAVYCRETGEMHLIENNDAEKTKQKKVYQTSDEILQETEIQKLNWNHWLLH